jgi:hypothetical protein
VEKVVWVLWRAADADPSALEPWLVERLSGVLDRTGGVRLTVEDPAGKWMRRGALADGSLLASTVSVWLGSIDDREPVAAALAGAPASAVHAYLVAESVPRDYGDRRDWPDGQRSPGQSLTTVFDKHPDIDDERFFALWHGEHTPLSFEIHPFWSYVRNTVVRSLTPGAPTLRAIVDEAVPTSDDLYDLHRFFGSGGDDGKLGERMAQVDAHVGSFAEPNLQTTPSHEWILKSPPWGDTWTYATP